MQPPPARAPKASDYAPFFGLTFGATALLTFIAVPFFLAGGTGGHAASAFMSFFLAGLVFAVPVLIKSACIAPIVFFPTFYLMARLLPIALAYILCAALAAYLSCLGGMSINIDLVPPTVSLVDYSWLTTIISATATVLSVVVSSLQMAAGGIHG